jgi:hypothetical protein
VHSPTLWAVLEMKDMRVVEAAKAADQGVKWERIYTTYPGGTRDEFGEDCSYLVDPVATLAKLEVWIKNIILHVDPQSIQTVVIDGISDMRDYALQEWIKKDNAARKSYGKPLRHTIGEENLSAYSAVNQRVRRLIEPLMNWAMANGINLLLTSQMKEKWVDRNRVGMEIDLKPWITYPAESIFILHHDGPSYFGECYKVPHWTKCPATVSLARETGLFELLSAESLIEKRGSRA